MLQLPVNTFGYKYAEWMSKYGFNPSERPKSRYIPDIELAYIM